MAPGRYASYYHRLESEADVVYNIAREARTRGLDPSLDVEIFLAQDMASRVESLVGPRG